MSERNRDNTSRRSAAPPPDDDDFHADAEMEAGDIRDDESASVDERTGDESGASGPAEAVAEESRDVQAELQDLENRLKRVSADYQNYVRRSQQHVAEAREQQLRSLARDLVTVLDHFDRALEADPEKTNTQSLLSGVQMVRDELLRTLGRYGIARIEAAPGEPFDPNRHEAMMRQPSDQVESNHVTAQLQPGYELDGRTIRPAGVAVAE